jgi:uncharacterized membrane protein
MDIRKIKLEAKELIRDKWLILFVVILIMGAISGLLGGFPMPVLMFGFYLIINDLFLGKEMDFNRFVDPFKDLNQAIKLIALWLLVSLIVFVGIILFIIPGIIFFLMYSQASYIMMDEPEIGILEAMRKSKDLMQGYKTHFFMFILSFIGHFLLVLLTFGIWIIYLSPYYNVAAINYYRHRKKVASDAVNEVTVEVVEGTVKEVEVEPVVEEDSSSAPEAPESEEKPKTDEEPENEVK